MDHARIRDIRARAAQRVQARHSFEVLQAGVADAGLGDVELKEVRESPQAGHPYVSDSCTSQIEVGEILVVFQVGQSVVGHESTRQREKTEAVKAAQFRETRVADS